MDISTNQVNSKPEHGLNTRYLRVRNRIGSFRERSTYCFHPILAKLGSELILSLLGDSAEYDGARSLIQAIYYPFKKPMREIQSRTMRLQISTNLLPCTAAG